MAKTARVIYWFRTDLRLHDSPALKAALDIEPEYLYPIWTWDPHYVYHARVGVNRWKFLIDCQNDLSSSISKLNPKSKLFVMREAPTTLFPKLFKAWNITHLVFEKDTDAYARDRDEQVKGIAKEAGIEVIIHPGRTLWDSDELVKQNGNKPTMSISAVMKAGEKLGPVSKPLPAPDYLPNPGTLHIEFKHEQPEVEPSSDLNQEYRTSDDCSYFKLAGPNGDFAPPTLEELGFPEATTPHRGGETVALKVLNNLLKDKKYIATFEKPKTAPTSFDPQSTTLLSPYLHFGALSVREFYWRVQDAVESFKGQPSEPPVSLTGQLMFRDMYFAAQAALGHKFSQCVGNPQCRFIPWHLPSTIDCETGLKTHKYTVDNEEADEWFRRWKEGRTGFPWIDAVMRQLKQEGWIHHLARHAVACFLTRGGCYIDWERGAEVFEELLIDHEPACNIGNWQWLSCTAFFSQYYRCYSPVAFPKKWDKDGEYVRRYVPELKGFPSKYIYEPWKCPIADQKKAGCRIQGDNSNSEGDMKTYPKPMFDFEERKQICLSSMKKAYDLKLYGNDKKVIDGDWKELFKGGEEVRETKGKRAGSGKSEESPRKKQKS